MAPLIDAAVANLEARGLAEDGNAGLVGLCCVELYYTPPSAWLTLGVLLATGLVFALLTLYFQKSLTILGSSFYGGAILLATTDYFIQDSLVLDWVWERVKVDVEDTHVDIMATIPKCWMAWIVSGIWPTIFLIGLIVQSCCTGTGTHHEESLPQVKYTKHTEQAETKEERKQRKYRYLYQVRMCHGDVISQVNRPIQGKYIQHLDTESAAFR